MTPMPDFPASIRRAPMFRDRTNAIATVILAAAIAYAGFRSVSWGMVNAIWSLPEDAGSEACRAARGVGACWAVIAERFRFILFGAYPFAEQWRPAAACLLFVILYLASTVRTLWNWRLLGLWILLPAAAVAVLGGGGFGLSEVPSAFWGGLPLTFLLSTVGCAVSFPLAVALALGRRSELPAIEGLCIAYIELVRGVPLVTFLFMAAVMFPLFVPQGLTMDKLLRAQVALVMVIAAYVAEVIRGGLQAIPRGRYRGCGQPRASLLAGHHPGRAASSAACVDSGARQHVHCVLQGHGPGDHHWTLRSAGRRQGGHRRYQVGGLRRRSVCLRGPRLLCVLLWRVAVQPAARAGVSVDRHH